MDKAAIRERVWDELADAGVARFPFPPHERIPNFAGAEAAAERLTQLDAWTRAGVVKANPDAPQLPVRRAALHAGKTVYVAVPRLQDVACFYRLEPAPIEDVPAATTVSGIGEYGEQVHPDAVEAVDLVVSGSVAVSESGDRIGKGEGYSDLEYAILSSMEAVTEETVTVTTVHERQVREEDWVSDDHDVPMEWVVTPERTIQTGGEAGPTALDWSKIDSGDRAEIPILEELYDS